MCSSLSRLSVIWYFLLSTFIFTSLLKTSSQNFSCLYKRKVDMKVDIWSSFTGYWVHFLSLQYCYQPLDMSLRSIINTKKACLIQASHWWRGEDLNFRPSGYEPDELPDCSTPRYIHSIHLNGFFFIFY